MVFIQNLNSEHERRIFFCFWQCLQGGPLTNRGRAFCLAQNILVRLAFRCISSLRLHQYVMYDIWSRYRSWRIGASSHDKIHFLKWRRRRVLFREQAITEPNKTSTVRSVIFLGLLELPQYRMDYRLSKHGACSWTRAVYFMFVLFGCCFETLCRYLVFPAPLTSCAICGLCWPQSVYPLFRSAFRFVHED